MRSEKRVQEVYKAWREDRCQDPILMYLQRVQDGLSWLGELANDGKIDLSTLLADIRDLRQRVKHDALAYDEAAEISTLSKGSIKNLACRLRDQDVPMPRGQILLRYLPLRPGLEAVAHAYSDDPNQPERSQSHPRRRGRTDRNGDDEFDSTNLAQHLTRSR